MDTDNAVHDHVIHGHVIKWPHFLRYWSLVRGNHRLPVNSNTKASDADLWMFSLIWALINGWVNNREAGDLRRHRAHYGVSIMWFICLRYIGSTKVMSLCKYICTYIHAKYIYPIPLKIIDLHQDSIILWNVCLSCSAILSIQTTFFCSYDIQISIW